MDAFTKLIVAVMVTLLAPTYVWAADIVMVDPTPEHALCRQRGYQGFVTNNFIKRSELYQVAYDKVLIGSEVSRETHKAIEVNTRHREHIRVNIIYYPREFVWRVSSVRVGYEIKNKPYFKKFNFDSGNQLIEWSDTGEKGQWTIDIREIVRLGKLYTKEACVYMEKVRSAVNE